MPNLGKCNGNQHKLTRKDMDNKGGVIIKPLPVANKPGQKGSNGDKPDKIIGGSAERSYFGKQQASKQKKQSHD